MKAIVNVSPNWGIGKNGDLLCRFKEDMVRFKNYTDGNIIICGRKTLESFPGGKPLEGRVNIVLTHDKMSIPHEVKKFPNYYVSVLRAKTRDNAAIVGVTKNHDLFDENPTSLVVVQDSSLILDVVKMYGRGKETYVCGGSSIYNQLLKYCNEVIVTKNDFAAEEPDSFFPNLDEDPEWYVYYDYGHKTSVDGIGYEFLTYKRVEKVL